MDRKVVFELDTDFIVRQVQPFGKGKYACRSPLLVPLFLQVAAMGTRLREEGVDWIIRHVYGDYNLVADALAREGALFGGREWSPIRGS